MVAVLLFNIRDPVGQRVGAQKVWRGDAMQDHVHQADDIGERGLLLAVEGPAFQRLQIGGGFDVGAQIVEGFAQKSRRPCRTVIDGFARLRVCDGDHGADQRAGGIILTAIAPAVAHILDAGFIQVGQFVLLLLAAECELVNQAQRIAQHVAVLEFVADFGEYLTDLVFDGIGRGRGLPEAAQVGHQGVVHEFYQIGADAGLVLVRLAVGSLRSRPLGPAETVLEQEGEGLAGQLRCNAALGFLIIEILQEQHP